MAQLEEAAVEAPVTYEDDESAAAALSEYLESEEEGDEPDDEDPDTDEAEQSDEDDAEEAEEGEDEEDGEDEPDEPAIDPPASLTAEEKANWSQLPPEAQQAIVAIESRRTAEVQQGLEKARNAQREAESAAAQRVAEAQKLFAEQQARLAQQYAPQKPDPRQYPDWQSYSAAEAQYETRLAQHEQLVQQLSGLHEEATKEQDRLQAEAMKHMLAEVRNDLPELADRAQTQELMERLTPLAIELGYPEDLLPDATPVDIRAIKRAAGWKEKADKYDAIMAKKMAGVRSHKGKSAKPGTAQPTGSGKARALSKATKRLRQTGSDADALAAFEAMGL